MAVGPAPLRRLPATSSTSRHARGPLSRSLAFAPGPSADVPVAGFENAVDAQEPSDVLIARYEQIAEPLRTAAVADAPTLARLSACTDPAGQELRQAQLVTGAGRRIFRRLLTPAESARWLAQLQSWRSRATSQGRRRLTLAAMLQSPQFLYRAEPTRQAGTRAR